MNEAQVRRLAQVRQALAGTKVMELRAEADDRNRHAWICSGLERCNYRHLAPGDRDAVLACVH